MPILILSFVTLQKLLFEFHVCNHLLIAALIVVIQFAASFMIMFPILNVSLSTRDCSRQAEICSNRFLCNFVLKIRAKFESM
jgi:hypothetical protein